MHTGLERHLFLEHGAGGGGVTCKWAGCPDQTMRQGPSLMMHLRVSVRGRRGVCVALQEGGVRARCACMRVCVCVRACVCVCVCLVVRGQVSV